MKANGGAWNGINGAPKPRKADMGPRAVETVNRGKLQFHTRQDFEAGIAEAVHSTAQTNDAYMLQLVEGAYVVESQRICGGQKGTRFIFTPHAESLNQLLDDVRYAPDFFGENWYVAHREIDSTHATAMVSVDRRPGAENQKN